MHAATMVAAGVYMVIRAWFVFEGASWAPTLMAWLGAITAFIAATMAITQRDIKKVLAYSTISQLGFMFVGAAGAQPQSGIFHLMTHAFFKAGLFLGAGSVMHAMSDRTDIFEMGGLRKRLPLTHFSFLCYTAAITGFPPLSGFWSKDAILGSALAIDDMWPRWHHFGLTITVLMLLAAAMTSFYMFRLYFLVFTGESRADPHTKEHIHESPPVMTVPLLILALLALVGGLIGTPFGDVFGEFLGGAPELHVPWANMLLGTGSFVLGALGAFVCYWNGVRAPVERFVAAVPWLYQLVFHKYYVDELYDLLFVRPTRWIARAFAQIFDRVLIDGLVGLLARVVDGAGYLVRQVQNGDVQRYLAAMVIGAAVM